MTYFVYMRQSPCHGVLTVLALVMYMANADKRCIGGSLIKPNNEQILLDLGKLIQSIIDLFQWWLWIFESTSIIRCFPFENSHTLILIHVVWLEGSICRIWHTWFHASKTVSTTSCSRVCRKGMWLSPFLQLFVKAGSLTISMSIVRTWVSVKEEILRSGVVPAICGSKYLGNLLGELQGHGHTKILSSKMKS